MPSKLHATRVCVAAGVQQRPIAAVVYQETNTGHGSTFFAEQTGVDMSGQALWFCRACTCSAGVMRGALVVVRAQGATTHMLKG